MLAHCVVENRIQVSVHVVCYIIASLHIHIITLALYFYRNVKYFIVFSRIYPVPRMLYII